MANMSLRQVLMPHFVVSGLAVEWEGPEGQPGRVEHVVETYEPNPPGDQNEPGQPNEAADGAQ